MKPKGHIKGRDFCGAPYEDYYLFEALDNGYGQSYFNEDEALRLAESLRQWIQAQRRKRGEI